MYSHSGWQPEYRNAVPRAWRRLSFIWSASLAGALFASAALADQALPLTLAEAEDLALRAEPATAAAHARADALAERAVAAGALPDPTLRVGLNNFPVESGGFSTEGMTNAMIGLRQAFPPGATRSIETRRLERLSAGADAEAEVRARDVLMQVRRGWLDAYYWRRAHEVVSASRPLFAELLAVTRSLYAVGRGDQQDVLRAELELSRLDDRLAAIAERSAAARAELGRWVGPEAARPVAMKAPSWPEPPALPALRETLAAHPALASAAARVAAGDAGVDLAEARFKPGWAVELGYSFRDGVLPNGAPRSDFVSLAVTVDLPVFRRNRQDRGLTAALSERSAAEYDKAALERQLGAMLEAEHARWHELSRRMAIYESRILAQSRERETAALEAYRSDEADFADVMVGRIDSLEAELEYARLRVERAQSYAVLANLGGLSR